MGNKTLNSITGKWIIRFNNAYYKMIKDFNL